jgi:perosamine synthetase
MQFHQIQQVQPWLGRSELEALNGCIERNWLTEGPAASAFRQSLSQLTGAPHVALAPNGTLGLFLALLALDLPRGSEIIIPGFTFMASASAAVFAGLKPVLIDVDPNTFTARPEAFERAITPRTSALMPVHIYGQAAYAAEIAAVGKRHGLAVIEDAAQACGVRYRGQHAGTFGDVGVISFFADKTITMGEGAVVLSRDQLLARRISLLRNQGRESSGSFIHEALGMNFRVTDMQCAVGQAQIARLPQVKADRLRRYQLFQESLKGLEQLRFMRVDPNSEFVPFRFPILCPRMPDLRQALETAGVQTRSMFYPLHRQPCLQGLVDPVDLPICDTLYGEGLCLPIHQGVQDSDVHHMVDVIRRTLSRRSCSV